MVVWDEDGCDVEESTLEFNRAMGLTCVASVAPKIPRGTSLAKGPTEGKLAADAAFICEGFASAHSKILRFRMMGLRLLSPSASESWSPKSSSGPANEVRKDSRRARGMKFEFEVAVDVMLEKDVSEVESFALDELGES